MTSLAEHHLIMEMKAEIKKLKAEVIQMRKTSQNWKLRYKNLMVKQQKNKW